LGGARLQAGRAGRARDGRVEVFIRQRNLSRGAGIWVDQPPYWFLWTLEGGKVTRVEFEWAEKRE
jgi:hypothetical protein